MLVGLPPFQVLKDLFYSRHFLSGYLLRQTWIIFRRDHYTHMAIPKFVHEKNVCRVDYVLLAISAVYMQESCVML